MQVLVEREDPESVLITIKGSVGVGAELPLFDPYEDRGRTIYSTDSLELSLNISQAYELAERLIGELKESSKKIYGV